MKRSGWDLLFFRADSTLGHCAWLGLWGEFVCGAVVALFSDELMLREVFKHFRCQKQLRSKQATC